MRILSLFIFGLDIHDFDADESERELLEAAFRYSLREIGLDPRPVLGAHSKPLSTLETRPLALAFVETSQGREIRVLWSTRLHMFGKGNLCRGTWDTHAYSRGEKLRSPTKFGFIVDEIVELAQIGAMARSDDARIEEIDLSRARRMLRSQAQADQRRLSRLPASAKA